MKKKWLVMLLICFCFTAFIVFFHKTVKIMFITDVTTTENTVSFLQNNNRYSNVYELDKNNVLQKIIHIKKNMENTSIESTNIVKDELENTYVLSKERKENEITKQYIGKYDSSGKQETIFVCQGEGHNNHVLKNLQYIENQKSIVSFLIEDNTTIQAIFYDTVEEKSWKKTYSFQQQYDVEEILYDGNGGIYFTTKNNQLFFINQQNELIEITLPQHCVPYKLSIDERNNQLYFNNIHDFSFVRYIVGTKELEVIYTQNDTLPGNFTFDKIRDLKYERGYFLASTPLYETEDCFFYVGTETEGRIVDSMKKNIKLLCQSAIVPFISFFLLLCIVRLCWYAWHGLKKVLVRVVMVMVVLLTMGTGYIGTVLYKEVLQEMINEVYAQLYIISTMVANTIDGDILEEALLLEEEKQMYFEDIMEKIQLDMTPFYRTANQAMKKQFYYTVYFIEEGELYVGIDNTHSGRKELYNTNEKYIANQEDRTKLKQNVKEGKAVLLDTADMTEIWLSSSSVIYNSGGQAVGVVEVGMNESDIVSYAGEILRRTIIIVLIVIVILVVLTTLVLKQFLKGIGNLKTSVEAITQGDWNVAAEIHSHDELEEIGNAFNRMTSRIKGFLDAMLQINTACEKFLPTALFEKIGKDNITELELGDQAIMNMYILTVKASNFYDVAKDMPVEEKFVFINELLGLFSGVIGETKGIIESYQSAGMRVVYTEEPDQIVDTALKIAEKIQWYNQKNQREIQLTMTLQNGETMLGIAGEERHMAISLVSENIDLIYTLEKEAEENDMILLLTKDVIERLEKKQKYHFRRVMLPLEKQIERFDCINAYASTQREQRKQAFKDFMEGTNCCEKGNFVQARKHFVDAIHIAPNDVLTKKHIFYCDKIIADQKRIVLSRRKLVK